MWCVSRNGTPEQNICQEGDVDVRRNVNMKSLCSQQRVLDDRRRSKRS